MKLHLKKLNRQVMVITGASSGIGLVTARMAARRGARLILAARNDEALRELVQQINEDGGEAYFVNADVSREEDVRRLARNQLLGRGVRLAHRGRASARARLLCASLSLC